jgi:cyclopropane-fatty-acyl-phospholipid synthase
MDGGIRIRFWDGSELMAGNVTEGGPVAEISFKSKEALARVFANPSLGFGEGYMRGDIEIEGSLEALLEYIFSKNLMESLGTGDKLRLCWLKLRGGHSIKHCKRDIQTHYDRGNSFYRLWLDSEMNYSCAYFETEADGLEEAQRRKNLHSLRKLRLKDSERLLDIGCGWGALVKMAARDFRAYAVGITLSRQQQQLASRRMEEEGLGDRAEIRLQDYREIPASEHGTYDKIVSIGMFEHVGREKYRTFFKKAARLLKDKGLFLLHTICRMVPEELDPWLSTYIFPGGYIPSMGQVLEAAAKEGFEILDIEDLRRHYDLTIGHWLDRFEGAASTIAEMKGKEFVRMWRLYLASSRMSFRSGGMHVCQFLFAKGRIAQELPLTRRWMHCP